ncbi:MAG: Lon protease family protein [Burkholderiaceae bacterium]
MNPNPLVSLSPEQLTRRTDPARLTLDLPADRPPSETGTSGRTRLVGHERAARAIDYALRVKHPGYNLFVMGPLGIGKTRFLREALARQNKQIVPVDHLYLNNFESPDKPIAVQVKAGDGRRLRAAMTALQKDLRATLQAAFEADTYVQQIARIQKGIARFDEQTLEAIRVEAQADGLALMQTPEGLVITPMAGDEPMSPEQVADLTEEAQNQLRVQVEAVNEKLMKANRAGMAFRRQETARIREINRTTAASAVEPAIEELLSEFGQAPVLDTWINSLQQDLLEHFDAFLPQPEETETGALGDVSPQHGRYEVNVLTEGACDDAGPGELAVAPLVQLDHPTVPELVGRVESQVIGNAMQTDFRMIKPGALHQANGGYLLIDAWRLFSEPHAWDTLKRALQRKAIRIETITDAMFGANGRRLNPAPIDLDVKVILFGERETYYTLGEHDPEFDALFRVAADFDDALERDDEHQNGLAEVLAEQTAGLGLQTLDRSALARLIDEAARRADDQDRLSAHVQVLVEIAVEADDIAMQLGDTTVTANHIATALQNRRDRACRAHIEHQRTILNDTVLIATEGQAMGQVNGLAVYDIGGEAFGHPSRISASTRLGDGQVLDVQRETQMGGPIHTKGVMTLSAYFGARYAPRHPLPVNASLVFEQSYGPIDGDSATVAELVALVSSIAMVPVRQDLAITGSMNQFGQVQAIGGLNHKVEGFYEICKARGLTGMQGVILPLSNIKHLMLEDEIIAAVAEGQFHLYAISEVDEAIELMLNMPAGKAGDTAAQNSVSGLVAQRLTDLLSQRNGGRAAARRARYAGGDRD